MHEDGMPQLPQNESGLDRGIRIVLGVALFAVGVSGIFDEPVAGALRLASLVPIALGAFGWCPLYQLLGLSTAAPRSRDPVR